MEKMNSYIKLERSERAINQPISFHKFQINISHRSYMKKASLNSKGSNKLNFKISLILFKILALINVYLVLYIRGKNYNKVMKHAILLLSSYGINYMNNVLSQFNNDKRFDIFIHIDGNTKIDIENNKTITKSRIKYIKHIYKSKRFSFRMVDAMLELINIANKTDEYDYFHFFSDSCYLIKTLDEFYQFFIQNINKSFMDYNLTNHFLYKNQSFILYKSSQWMSLHRNIMHKLLDNINLIHKYKSTIKNNIIRILRGASDELIIQNIIIKDICKRKPQEFNIINNNLRFIRWRRCKKIYCPNYLDIDNVSEKEIENIKKNYLVIRKIDYINYKAIDLVNRLKGD